MRCNPRSAAASFSFFTPFARFFLSVLAPFFADVDEFQSFFFFVFAGCFFALTVFLELLGAFVAPLFGGVDAFQPLFFSVFAGCFFAFTVFSQSAQSLESSFLPAFTGLLD